MKVELKKVSVIRITESKKGDFRYYFVAYEDDSGWIKTTQISQPVSEPIVMKEKEDYESLVVKLNMWKDGKVSFSIFTAEELKEKKGR